MNVHIIKFSWNSFYESTSNQPNTLLFSFFESLSSFFPKHNFKVQRIRIFQFSNSNIKLESSCRKINPSNTFRHYATHEYLPNLFIAFSKFECTFSRIDVLNSSQDCPLTITYNDYRVIKTISHLKLCPKFIYCSIFRSEPFDPPQRGVIFRNHAKHHSHLLNISHLV